MGRCPDCCSDVLFLANIGKCIECSGTGINIHLNSDQPACPNCGGTGVCPSCRGTGLLRPGNPEIQSLFG
jgi:hypothetical protein